MIDLKLFVLTQVEASQGEVTEFAPKLFASAEDAKDALEKEYEDCIEGTDIFENEIDEDGLEAYVVTDDDTLTKFKVHEVEVEI